jgi:hypothetical protein
MRVPAPPMWLVMIALWTAVIAFAYALVTCAHAADDAVCKPYASALLNNNMSFFWQRAFNHCKILEENNPVPPPPGDWRAALDILIPDHTPISQIGIAPAQDKPVSPAVHPAIPEPAKAAAPVRSSASAAATKCKATHPQGFQANGGAGTYNTLFKGKWVRVPCPS